MIELKVYHISRTDLGDAVRMVPRIPDFCDEHEENTTIKRICVAPTIIGCIRALELPESMCLSWHGAHGDENFFAFNRDGKPFPLYLYSATIPTAFLYSPTVEQVPDVWITGGLWVLSPCNFKKEANLTIRKHMDLPNCAYSRYVITKEGDDEVADRISAPVIYGNDMYNFSFIGHNIHRDAAAQKYAEDNRLYY